MRKKSGNFIFYSEKVWKLYFSDLFRMYRSYPWNIQVLFWTTMPYSHIPCIQWWIMNDIGINLNLIFLLIQNISKEPRQHRDNLQSQRWSNRWTRQNWKGLSPNTKSIHRKNGFSLKKPHIFEKKLFLKRFNYLE